MRPWSPRRVAAAACMAQLVTLYLLAMNVLAAPTEVHWQHADPIFLFVLLHELGSASAPPLGNRVTRFLIPGCAMGVVFIFRPSFLILAHCGAHIVMPLLFS